MSTAQAISMERRLDRYANLQPPFPRWLGGAKADGGGCFCQPCAEKAVAEGRGKFVDGGWSGIASDGCCHCIGCGCLLEYTLTDYGVEVEIEHFRDQRFRAPLNREEAYHIARIIEAAPDNSEAIEISRLANSKIPKKARHGQRRVLASGAVG